METSSGNDGQRNDGVHQKQHPSAGSHCHAGPSQHDAAVRPATTAVNLTTIFTLLHEMRRLQPPHFLLTSPSDVPGTYKNLVIRG